MRHKPSLSKLSGIGLSLRLFRRPGSIVLWQVGIALTAINAYGQTSMLSTPQQLLTTDPRAFAQWLEIARPAPVSAQDKAHILRTLPTEGEVTRLNASGRRKLASLTRLLHATERASAYEIKVVDTSLARVGLFERTVILITEAALTLMEADDLQALVAHEIGHEYVNVAYVRASRDRDYRRLKELELLCDAIAMVTLHGLGLDPSRLMAIVEKLTRYNRKFFGAGVDETAYPTLSERQEFARAVRGWLARAPRALPIVPK